MDAADPPLRGFHDHFCLYDFNGFLEIERAERLLKERYAVRDAPAIKGAPEYVTFAPALLLDFGPRGEFALPDGSPCRMTAKIFEVGAMSIRFSMPLSAPDAKGLSRRRPFSLMQGGKALRKDEVALALFREVKEAILPSLLDRYEVDLRPEHYSVFGLERPEGDAGEWAQRHRRALAGLLSGEDFPERLVEAEVDEILNTRSSYYREDVVIVGSEAAVLATDQLKGTEDVLAILELACLQVLELRSYDAYLDRVLEKAAADMRAVFAPGGFMTGRPRRTVEELAEIRAELEHMIDEINNAAKFYGDQYLARFYLACRRKLNVDRWLDSVVKRLRAVGELYTLAASESTNRRLVVLEALIVLLIVFEIVMAFVRPG